MEFHHTLGTVVGTLKNSVQHRIMNTKGLMQLSGDWGIISVAGERIHNLETFAVFAFSKMKELTLYRIFMAGEDL